MDEKDWDALAENYHDHVISPFQEGVINPLFDAIREIQDREPMTVADLGCGTGPLLSFLSKHFKAVIAVDFSEKMLEKAKENCSAKNVTFIKSDLSDLSQLEGRIDVAVSINAILLPSVRLVDAILMEIHRSLKPDGRFMGIFPSLEAVLYQSTLIYDRELGKYEDETDALNQTKRILEKNKFDFIAGTYDDHGQKQKFYYDFEIRLRLKKAGFKNIRLKKVLYPWGGDVSGYEDFFGQPRMWDWFVIANRRDQPADGD
jgi:ubiquinone/menaquinone biosynthesis C-methylase UbiE